MTKKGIKLGDEIEDVTSKTIGIAIAKTVHLDGSVFWLCQPYTGEDNEMLRPVSLPDAYCRRKGDGVYPSTKPVMGFHAREVDGNGG